MQARQIWRNRLDYALAGLLLLVSGCRVRIFRSPAITNNR